MNHRQTPAYEMKPIPGAGFGMVATRLIPRGTLIISEAPLFTTTGNIQPEALTAKIQSLSEDQKQTFFSLHNSHPQESPVALGILRTNGIQVEVGDISGGIFPKISRFNHSCASNAGYSYNIEAAEETVYAVKDIAAGEEITVCYLGKVAQNQPRNRRQRTIMNTFKFECRCNTCAASQQHIADSDRRRREINDLDAMVGDGISATDPAKSLRCCKRILELYKEEGICHLAVYTTYFDAFETCILHGDRARASAFASLAAEIKQTCQGENVQELREVKSYISHPELYKDSEQFRTWATRTQSTRAVGTDGFEEWLWSRTESDDSDYCCIF